MLIYGQFNAKKRFSSSMSAQIIFDYPSEILTHVTGYYGSTILRGPIVVKSLTFHTNKMKYGPFGDEQGIFFSSGSNNGFVVGFHGRKGWFIDSIGVHVAQVNLSRQSRPSHDPPVSTNIQAYEVRETTPSKALKW